MANFPRVRPGGFWTLFSVLFSSEMETFDDRQSKTINAFAGSTHAPTSQIVIGGSGLRVTDHFELTGTTHEVHSGAVMTWDAGSFFNSEGTIQLGNTSIITATGSVWNLTTDTVVTFDASSFLNVEGTVQLGSSSVMTATNSAWAFAGTTVVTVNSTAFLHVDGTFRLRSGSIGTVTDASLTIQGASTFAIAGTTAVTLGSGVTVADAATTTKTGTTALQAQTIYSGNNAFVGRRIFNSADVNGSHTPSNFDYMIVPQLTALRTYTLNPPTTPSLCCEFTLIWYSMGSSPGGTDQFGPGPQPASTGNLAILSSTGSINLLLVHHPGALVNPYVGGQFYSLRFLWTGTDWTSVSTQSP